MWDKLSMKDKAAYIKMAVKNGITDLNTLRDIYNEYSKGGPVKKYNYPEVTLKEEPWAENYFRNNTNVAGMAIGGGSNGIEGPRRVIVNPYNSNMQNAQQRAGLIKNERLRHYMEETNFNLPNLHSNQIHSYKNTPYENDSINIGRTEAARYLTGDKSHHLSDTQKEYMNTYLSNNRDIINSFADGGPFDVAEGYLYSDATGEHQYVKDENGNIIGNDPSQILPEVTIRPRVETPWKAAQLQSIRNPTWRNTYDSNISGQEVSRNILTPTFETLGKVYSNTLGRIPIVSDVSEFAGSLVDIPALAGTIRSGKDPWNPENRGFGEYDILNRAGVAEDTNNYFNVASTLLGGKAGYRSYKAGKNLTPKRLREHIYEARAPWGYDDIPGTIGRLAKGIISGEDANTVRPWWYEDSYRKKKGLIATDPNLFKNRDAAWRLYLGLPQDRFIKGKGDYYTLPLEYASDNQKAIRFSLFGKDYLDTFKRAEDGITGGTDTVYGVQGGNLTEKRSKINPETNLREGVTVTKDYWDLQPFKTPAYKLAGKVKNKKLRNLLRKAGEFEASSLIGGKPFNTIFSYPWEEIPYKSTGDFHNPIEYYYQIKKDKK